MTYIQNKIRCYNSPILYVRLCLAISFINLVFLITRKPQSRLSAICLCQWSRLNYFRSINLRSIDKNPIRDWIIIIICWIQWSVINKLSREFSVWMLLKSVEDLRSVRQWGVFDRKWQNAKRKASTL